MKYVETLLRVKSIARTVRHVRAHLRIPMSNLSPRAFLECGSALLLLEGWQEVIGRRMIRKLRTRQSLQVMKKWRSTAEEADENGGRSVDGRAALQNAVATQVFNRASASFCGNMA
jgi:hypothetical protein